MTLKELVDQLGLGEETPARILIVEDQLEFAGRLKHFLEEAGHSVQFLLGVDQVEGGVATGRAVESEPAVSVDLREIDLAFVDHYFLGALNGATFLTAAFQQRPGMVAVGMSSDMGANGRMVQAGAVFAIRKPELARLIGP